MAHYFTNDDVKSEEHLIKIKINDQLFSFYVDNGVFSKKGLDFGTRTLLENIDIKSIYGDVLDLGCGYGPIGIFIAKNTSAYVDMIDINKRSLNLSCKNAMENKVTVNVFESDAFKNINKKYDYIITNPPIRVGKKKLYEILFGAYDFLKKDGQMWLVVSKSQGAKSVFKDLQEKYLVDIVCKNKGFYIFKASKRI